MLENFDSEDSLLKERIEFKENIINDLAVRIEDADIKINLMLKAKNEYEKEKRKYLSAEVSLECCILEDAIETNILEMAEILAEFLNRLRTKIPAHCHLFRKSKKILSKMNEDVQKIYVQSRSFLFPEETDNTNNGKAKDSFFHAIADKLQSIGDPILKFRDKVLAHKYDKDRFNSHLSFEQYCKIREAFKSTLNAVAIVGTLSSNDWLITRSSIKSIEIERTVKWLTEGLITSVSSICRSTDMEPGKT